MIVIGLGTGRCGTQTLAHLLDMQDDAFVTHEKNPHALSWHGSKDIILRNLGEFERSLESGRPLMSITYRAGNEGPLSKRKGMRKLRLVGDVAFYYLPYVEAILNENKKVKFVCIKRNEDATVSSYLKWTANRKEKGFWGWLGRRGEMNHWMMHDGKYWSKNRIWDKCYPKYAADTKEQAIRLYWREYYDTANRLEEKFPMSVKVFPIDSLNSLEGQQAILSFIGIPAEDMVIRVGMRDNWQEY